MASRFRSGTQTTIELQRENERLAKENAVLRSKVQLLQRKNGAVDQTQELEQLRGKCAQYEGALKEMSANLVQLKVIYSDLAELGLTPLPS